MRRESREAETTAAAKILAYEQMAAVQKGVAILQETLKKDEEATKLHIFVVLGASVRETTHLCLE